MLSVAFLFCLAACGAETPAAPKPVRLGEPFDLAVGETALVDGANLRVSFGGVTLDSRCPTGVLCVWEGDAVARIDAAMDARARTSYDLHTSGRFSRQATYQSYRITLVDLAPYPNLDRTIEPRDYSARLKVEAAPGNPAP